MWNLSYSLPVQTAFPKDYGVLRTGRFAFPIRWKKRIGGGGHVSVDQINTAEGRLECVARDAKIDKKERD